MQVGGLPECSTVRITRPPGFGVHFDDINLAATLRANTPEVLSLKALSSKPQALPDPPRNHV